MVTGGGENETFLLLKMCWNFSTLSSSLPHLKAHDLKKKKKKLFHFHTFQKWNNSNFFFLGVLGEKSAKFWKNESPLLLLLSRNDHCSPAKPTPEKVWQPYVCSASESLTLNVTCCAERTTWTRVVWFIRATQSMKDGRHPAVSRVLCYCLLRRFIFQTAGTLIAPPPKAALHFTSTASPPMHININFFFLPHPNNYLLCKGFTVTLQLKATCISPTSAVRELIFRILNLLPINFF